MQKKFCLNVKSKLLIHFDGYKQGRFKEYFMSTEIKSFLDKKGNKPSESKTRFFESYCYSDFD